MVKMIAKQQSGLYGLVLVGGKSTRMKKDKAMLVFHARPQFEHVYALLSQFCEKVFLSTRRDQAKKASFRGFPQIQDDKCFAGSGPLAGILSAMTAFPQAAWVVLGCDLPFVTARTLSDLLKKRDRRRIATAFRSSYDGLPEPLCAIYEAKAGKVLRNLFARGIKCPRKILINSKVKLLRLSDARALDNINVPEQYHQAAAALAKKADGAAKKVHLQYYALLREERGLARETVVTDASTIDQLFAELKRRYLFSLPAAKVRPVINDAFVNWRSRITDGDQVVFIPPVAGG